MQILKNIILHKLLLEKFQIKQYKLKLVLRHSWLIKLSEFFYHVNRKVSEEVMTKSSFCDVICDSKTGQARFGSCAAQLFAEQGARLSTYCPQ